MKLPPLPESSLACDSFTQHVTEALRALFVVFNYCSRNIVHLSAGQMVFHFTGCLIHVMVVHLFSKRYELESVCSPLVPATLHTLVLARWYSISLGASLMSS
jgi:hypothetical protein